MQIIASLDQYQQALRTFRTKAGKPTTNCFLMPQELKAAIADGNCSLHETDNALLLYLKKQDYTSLYYYLAPDSSINDVPVHEMMPLVADTPVKIAEECLDQIPAHPLEHAGFAYLTTHLRLAKVPEAQPVSLPQGFTAEQAQVRTGDVCNLWRANIDPLTTVIPSLPGPLESNEQLFCIKDVQGNLCSAMLVVISGKSALVEHVSTDTAFQGRGLALAMMHYAESLLAEQGIASMKLWVDKQNIPARKLYCRCGFQYDNLASHQFIKK